MHMFSAQMILLLFDHGRWHSVALEQIDLLLPSAVQHLFYNLWPLC